MDPFDHWIRPDADDDAVQLCFDAFNLGAFEQQLGRELVQELERLGQDDPDRLRQWLSMKAVDVLHIQRLDIDTPLMDDDSFSVNFEVQATFFRRDYTDDANPICISDPGFDQGVFRAVRQIRGTATGAADYNADTIYSLHIESLATLSHEQ